MEVINLTVHKGVATSTEMLLKDRSWQCDNSDVSVIEKGDVVAVGYDVKHTLSGVLESYTSKSVDEL